MLLTSCGHYFPRLRGCDSTSCFASAPDTSRAMLVYVRTPQAGTTQHLRHLLASPLPPEAPSPPAGVTLAPFMHTQPRVRIFRSPPLGLACDKASHLARSLHSFGSFPAGWRPRHGPLLQAAVSSSVSFQRQDRGRELAPPCMLTGTFSKLSRKQRL